MPDIEEEPHNDLIDINNYPEDEHHGPRYDEDCVNDDSKFDNGGDTCSDYYDIFSATCGLYDTIDFKAARECCICGGGSRGNGVEQINFDDMLDEDNLYQSVGALSTIAVAIANGA